MLGTDLLAKLGFQVLQAPNDKGQIVELLQGGIWTTNQTGRVEKVAPTTVVKILTEQSVGGTHVLPPPGNKNSGLESSNEGRPPVPGENDKATIQVTTAEVKRLKAVRIPARHAKRVTWHTESNLRDQDLYLESLQKNLNTEKVKATEALVKINPHHEKNYGASELEALAVVWAVKHFRVYLYGHKCKDFTDHEALLSLLNTPREACPLGISNARTGLDDPLPSW